MAKTKRKAGKRGTTADRDGLRVRKSGVSKAHKPGLRKPKSPKTDPRKQKPSLRSETARLKRQLKAARMQQEASAEILRAVANASGDAAGPLQLIAETTARLFNASSVSIQLAEGSDFTQEYRVGAIAKRVGAAYPRSNIKVGGRNLPGTVVAESRQIHIPDLDHLDPSMSDFPGLPHARAGGARTVCGTPLRREDKAIGALIVFRDRLLPFTSDELALQQSFADQAVIAIENVRLFDEVQAKTNDLEEALQQQTATADILRIISRSVAHAAPVFDIILESCERLFNPYDAAVYLVDGDRVRGVARRGPGAGDWGADSMPLEGSSTGVAIAQRQPVHFPDLADKADLPEDKRALVEAAGGMTVLYAPMISQDSGVGSLVVTRRPKKPFTKAEIGLIQTFADQAVIAIENVRLFEQVQAKTRDLSESLQQQIATAEVLNVISNSPGELGPVFTTVLENATRICDARFGTLLRFDGNAFYFATDVGTPAALAEYVRRPGPFQGLSGGMIDRILKTRQMQHTPDYAADPAPGLAAKLGGARSALGVPILKDDVLVGAIVIYRQEVRPFSNREIELVRSFAAQAAIAIENARLFNETQESLAFQTGSSNVLRVIASSPTDVEPVLKAIVESARELCEANDAVALLRDVDDLRFSAHSGPIAITLDKWPISRNWTAGRAFVDQKPVHVHDMLSEEGAEFPDARAMGQSTGSTIHTVLSVPLLRGNESIGAILLRRTEVRPFNDKQINLLSAFADQAVIAIQNARLFNETREALERQTATADVLKIIAASPTDVQPVFEAIVQTAVRLLGCETSFIQRCDSRSFWSVARCRKEGLLPLLNPRPGPIDPAANFPSRAMLAKKTLYLPDWSEIELPEFERRIQQELGYNCAIYLPLLHKDECLGVLGIAGSRPRMFSEADIALAEAFRDQAVIAIRNTQLFEEVQQRTHELSQSLNDLRTAQDRLVQTEKLASLGQLTAGIAHEIKNPLNFVNNFSALSAELVDELDETLAPAPLDQKMRVDVGELTQMLKSNLEKVVQHGKRADSIVKNMLLHSREGSGEHRSADINALVEESLNLAYHGARAEKPGFNVTLKRELDPDAGAVELYPQEMTRALLNLISNGFYAVTQRKSQDGENFEPILIAATKNRGKTVEIRIHDNGTGIPSGVREKMFNPFFTTKPSGEGTGLGLSMSHDIIVKQHGGTIEVETEPGLFTEFRIVLPRTSQK